jgi:hypothetical protein
VPVNLLEHDGARYLVAPRGETEWLRNLRARGIGELRLGSRVEEFRAIELGDPEKPPILRVYLERWWFELSRFFADVADVIPRAAVIAAAVDGEVGADVRRDEPSGVGDLAQHHEHGEHLREHG